MFNTRLLMKSSLLSSMKSLLKPNYYRFSDSENSKWHHTTILALKKNKELVLIGDG